MVAADIFIYIDDARVTGYSEMECWKAEQRVSRWMSHMGIQDDTRKRRGPRKDPGAWAGAVLRTDGLIPKVQVSHQESGTRRSDLWLS